MQRLTQKINSQECFDEKGLMRMFNGDIVLKLRGLCIKSMRKLDELCNANYAFHMVEDYEALVSQHEKEITDLKEVA